MEENNELTPIEETDVSNIEKSEKTDETLRTDPKKEKGDDLTSEANASIQNDKTKEDAFAAEEMESSTSKNEGTGEEEKVQEEVLKNETAEEVIQVKESIETPEQPANEVEKEEPSEPKKVELDETVLTSELAQIDSPTEILALAPKVLNFEPKKALKRLREMKSRVGELLREQKKSALEKWVEEGNNPVEFIDSTSEEMDQINVLIDNAKSAYEAEKNRLENQKIENLKKKQAMLLRLKEITEQDETEKTLDQVKEIQREWKQIRILPQDKVNELWDEYNYLQNKYYDNHGINIELKELDRKKNLEQKIELCKKVDSLLTMHSIKRSFILLNKYREEFRNIGPVPKEFNEEIWTRFNGACDKVYAEKKGVLALLDEEKNANLEKKTILVEKASLIAAIGYDKTKQWSEKTKELDELMELWKKIGPVPKANNETIWKDFRGHFNTFYDNKSAYFKTLNAKYKANLILKQDLIKQAEEFLNHSDMDFATKEIIKLQKEWKAIGPVAPKVSNSIWKKFRGICDDFFNKKDESRAEQNKIEADNLEQKQALIKNLNELVATGKADEVETTLKEIQKAWRQIGFVPFKAKKKIEKEYENAANAVFEAFKLEKKSYQEERAAEHFKDLANMPGGTARLKDEEQKIKKKIGFLKGEIDTLENNKEFFGRSSSAQKLKLDIEKKIEQTQVKINRLKTQLKAIKDAKQSIPAT